MIKFLVLLLLPTAAHSDMSECMNIPAQDKKNYCMASYSGSAAFCDKIKSFESRTQCMRMVIQKQRQSTFSVKPKQDPQ